MTTFLRELSTNTRGNVGMLACLAAPFLFMTVGLSVDFTVKNNAKILLQNSLDSALLAAAHGGNDSERNAVAAQYITENFASKYGGHSISVTISSATKGELQGVASVVVPTIFGGLFGSSESTVTAVGAVKTNAPPLEVMLVLDKTGSMAGAKIDALKAAAHLLIDKIMDGDKVRVGVIPFARYVNIGMGLRNEPGFSIPADTQSCGAETVTHYSNPHNCRVINSTCGGGNAPDGGPPLPTFACSWTQCDYDETTTTENVCHQHQWHGCVGSRADPLNLEDSNTGTPVPGLLDHECGDNTITRLTKDKATIASAIDDLNADGETYIPSGLMMGWHAISSRPILPDGADPAGLPGGVITQAIVLMTDGANTASRTPNQPDHDSGDANAANLATKTLCENIKADHIKVYTIAFTVTDAGIKSILKDCASSSGDAFDADNTAELSKAFDQIGDSLTRIRLSR